MVERVRIGGGSNARGTSFGFAGGGLSSALGAAADIGDAAQAHFAEQGRQRDLVTSAEERGQTMKEIDTEVADLDASDPDYPAKVEEVYANAIRRTLENSKIRNSAILNQLELDLTRAKAEALPRASAELRKTTLERGARVFGDERDAMLAKITADPDGAPVFTDEFAASFAKIGELIDADEREALFDETMELALKTRILAYGDQGQDERAKELLEANADMFSPAERRDIEKKLRGSASRLRTEVIRANTEKIADLEVGIIEGTVGLDDIDEADKAGLFEGQPRMKAVLMRQINTRDRKAQADQLATQDILERLTAGVGLKNAQEADVAYRAMLGEEERPPEQRRQIAAFVTQESGYVPETIKRQVRAGGNTTRPAVLAEAAQTHAAIVRDSPSIDTGANDRVQLTSTYIRAFGLPPQEAAQLVLDNEPEPAVRKERLAAFDDEDFDPIDDLTDIGFDEDDIVPGLAADYSTLVRGLYLRSGDLSVAQAAAAERVGRTYGITNTGGVSQMVKNPPELFGINPAMFGPSSEPLAVQTRTAVVNELVQNELDRLGVEPQIPAGTAVVETVPKGADAMTMIEGGIADLEEETRLVSDSDAPPWKLTYIEGTNPPRYTVSVLNVYGGYSRVFIWDGASDEEVKATETWKAFEANQERIAQKQFDIEQRIFETQQQSRDIEVPF